MIELSPSHVSSRLLNKKRRVVLQPRTAQPVTANVKVEDVVAEIASGSKAELRIAVRNASKSCRMP